MDWLEAANTYDHEPRGIASVSECMGQNRSAHHCAFPRSELDMRLSPQLDLAAPSLGTAVQQAGFAKAYALRTV